MRQPSCAWTHDADRTAPSFSDFPLTVVPATAEDTGAADGVSRIVDMILTSFGPITMLVQSNTEAESLRGRFRPSYGWGGHDGEYLPRSSDAADGADGRYGGDACSAATVAGGPAVVNPCEGGLPSVGGKGGDGLPGGAEDGRISEAGWEADWAGDGGRGTPGQGGGGGGGRRGGLGVCGAASKGLVGPHAALPSPLPPVARPLLCVCDGHDKNARWLVSVHDEIGKPCQTHPTRPVTGGGPAVRRLRNSVECRLDLFGEPCRYAWIPFRVPRRSLLGFRECGWQDLKELHDVRLQPPGCGAWLPAKGPA
ncbi:PE-PGRS family protein [Sorangium cellulosum So ce56]|uniref:PE-PGRS family protein n=1 Tax=Sorangium cellulosum (strain So ce56) TaxID=448385 RepID=A9F481_SORC5|nr:PE-PGRS family protein [Sorangium cellulosum So ce56]